MTRTMIVATIAVLMVGIFAYHEQSKVLRTYQDREHALVTCYNPNGTQTSDQMIECAFPEDR